MSCGAPWTVSFSICTNHTWDDSCFWGGGAGRRLRRFHGKLHFFPSLVTARQVDRLMRIRSIYFSFWIVSKLKRFIVEHASITSRSLIRNLVTTYTITASWYAFKRVCAIAHIVQHMRRLLSFFLLVPLLVLRLLLISTGLQLNDIISAQWCSKTSSAASIFFCCCWRFPSATLLPSECTYILVYRSIRSLAPP